MLFSYAVRAVYVESCSMFTRGGVYRVVKEAMGSTLAKISVSALMFDYILTGPISGVSAGQYLVGLINELLKLAHSSIILPPDFTAAFFAIAVTVYFWRQNILGIEESSGKAMRIMQVTTVMAVIMIAWSGADNLHARFASAAVRIEVHRRLAGMAQELSRRTHDRRAWNSDRVRPFDPRDVG